MIPSRIELHRVLPLDTSFSIHIFPSFYCNFACNYCLHALNEEQLAEKGFRRQFMDWEIFQRAVDGVREFPGQVKALIFAGHGEPLLHHRIADMVAYAKQSGKFERVEIVTNGSLLTHALSDALIEAGLDRLRVSLQGVNADEYQSVSRVKLDFQAFTEQLRYFYERKQDTEVYIKIIDVALKQPGDEQRFRERFGPIADAAAVEYAIPFVKEVDYSNIGTLSEKCKQGHRQSSRICSMPFYMLAVNPDGTVVPCCSTDFPLSFGSLREKPLADIWGSPARRQFLRRQLHGAEGLPVCRGCTVPAFGLQPGDYLDGHESELLRRFEDESQN